MKKQITTALVVAFSFFGYTQVPDSTKITTNSKPNALPKGQNELDSLSVIRTENNENEEVIMDLNELMIADSTLTSLGGKKIILADSTKIIYQFEEKEGETRRDVLYRKSKDSETFVGPDVREADQLSMQSLEARTNEYFKKQEALPATFIIEGFPHQGVTVFLEGKPKAVHKAWKSYLYTTNKIKLKSKKAKSLLNRKKTPYFKATETTLTNVTHRIGDLITVFQKENGLVKMTVIYKLGYNASVNQENFPEAYKRLTNYVEHFSQVNFVEYYSENLKNLAHSIKVVRKEIKKERKVLQKLERNYNRDVRRNEADHYGILAIEVQKKLLKSLAMEKSFYEYRIIQYKSKNSEVRMKSVE